MPKGPQGQKRPADAVTRAVMVAQIATGEDEEIMPSDRRKSGIAGAAARAESLTSEKRRRIAQNAARARWSNGNDTSKGAI